MARSDVSQDQFESTPNNQATTKPHLTEKKISNEEIEFEEEIKRSPDFWLTVLRNCEKVSRLIQKDDVPILKKLDDIKINEIPKGFNIEFYFSPNEYFTNSVLTKEYTMGCSSSYDGPIIIGSKGCFIEWNCGKNVSIRLVKRSHMLDACKKTIISRKDSFFNFFAPPIILPTEKVFENTIAQLRNDYEVGYYLQKYLVPSAILYFFEEDSTIELQDYDGQKGDEMDLKLNEEVD